MAVETDDALRLEVRDGVPVYWTPEAPRLTGVLMFRVGRADETLITGGLTHLVEHLALYGFGAKQAYPFNGQVDGMRTLFHATGSPEEVASFMKRLCEAIADPPLDRIEAESRVLRTEAAGRTVGPVEGLLWYRFGSRGHGLPIMREYGLDAPDKEAVRAWAAEHFTAENATAWFSGPVPAGLSFAALPRGSRIPCPEPVPVPRLRTPAFLYGRPGGIAISFVTERDAWISVPWHVAELRLQERLRFRQGLTYSIQFAANPISACQFHSAMLVGCLDEHAAAVREGLLEVLESLARDGPTMEEIGQVRADFARGMTEPETVPAELDPASFNELIGYPVKSRRTLLREMEALTPERSAASVRTALQTALLMLPPGCPPPGDGMAPYPVGSQTRVRGRRFRSVSQRFPWSKKGPELIVGKEGVSIALPDGVVLTVLYDNCAGVVAHPDGVLHLVGNDPISIYVRAAEWRHGQRACDAILRAAPVGLLKVIPAP